MSDKFDPLPDKEYILTDDCFWVPLSEEDHKNYNPYDLKRTPHGVKLVDPANGTTVNLLSGSIIKVIKAKKHE